MQGSFASKPLICFEVEKIVGISSDGNYQVQWAPAWVSKFHLVGCDHLIQEFLQQQQPEMLKELESSSTLSQKSLEPNLYSQMGKNACERLNNNSVFLEKLAELSYDRSNGGDAFDTTVCDERSDVRLGSTGIHPNDPLLNTDVKEYPVRESSAEHENVVVKVEPDDTEEGIVYVNPSSHIPTSETLNENNDLEIPINPTQANEMNNLQTINSATNSQININHFSDEVYKKKMDLNSFNPSHTPNKGTGTTLHTCNVCHKSFPYKSKLVDHYRTHTGEKPHQCSFCGKSFNVKSKVLQHERIHTGEKPFHCTQCSYTTSVQSHLKVHLRTHTGERPYTCDLCEKSFSTSSHLKQHHRTHSKEKPFRCERCGKTFSQSHQRMNHLLTCGSPKGTGDL